MKERRLLYALGQVDGKYIEEASPVKQTKRPGWLKWGAMAACLAVVIIAGSLISRIVPDTTAPNGGSEIIMEVRDLNIYYLSENGTIENKSVEVRCTPENIFYEWAALNNISGVTFVSCVYDDNGNEQMQGEMVEHTSGSYFALELTVSAEFSSYAESEQGDLLIQSLRQTFYEYISFDNFNLIIE